MLSRTICQRICIYRFYLGQRYASVQASPAMSPSEKSGFTIDLPRLNGHGPFATKPHFQVLGTPFSLFNASIPSKAILYTRRGTLVGLNGDAQSISSTLSVFSQGSVGTATSLLSGAPFLYQKLQAREPFTALIGSRASATSFAIVELDGRSDWIIFNRESLLAWCGVQAQIKQHNLSLSLFRTSTVLTGRGSAVISGNGQIYQVVLQAGENYMVHPRSILGYADSCPEPQKMSLHSLTISVPRKLPSLSSFLMRFEFLRVMSAQPVWTQTKRFSNYVRQIIKNFVWGDQSFIRFQGPTTVLLQSRTGAAVTRETESPESVPLQDTQTATSNDGDPRPFAGSLKLASVADGKVTLVDTKSFL